MDIEIQPGNNNFKIIAFPTLCVSANLLGIPVTLLD